MAILAAIFSSITTVPWNWVVNAIQVGRLRARLEKELKELGDLKGLRELQLQVFKSQSSNLLRVHFRSLNLELVGAEPYVNVKFQFCNGSLYTIRLNQHKFQAYSGALQQLLASAPLLEWDSATMLPAGTAYLQVRQPVTSQTKESFITAIERRDKIRWQFKLETAFVIKETGDRFNFFNNAFHEAVPI